MKFIERKNLYVSIILTKIDIAKQAGTETNHFEDFTL